MVSQVLDISTWIGVLETPEPSAAPPILPCPEQELMEMQQAVVEVRGGFWQPSSAPPPEPFLQSLIPATTLTKSNSQVGFPNWSFQPLLPSNQQILTAALAYPATEFVELNDYNHQTLLHLMQNNVGVKERADTNLVPDAWLPDRQRQYKREAVDYARGYDQVAKRDKKEMWLVDLAYYVNKGVKRLEKERMEMNRRQTLIARLCRFFRATNINQEKDSHDWWEDMDTDTDSTESYFYCLGHITAPLGYTPHPASHQLLYSSLSSGDYLLSSTSTSNAPTYQKQLPSELTFPKRLLCPQYTTGNLYMAKQVTEYINTVEKAAEWQPIAIELQVGRV